ncbi:MAG: hypothetical protein HY645_02670 [Acidobacteria bacterium]|nr:hypothetical protein [Acidobacteriota bacterium]
MIYLQIIPTPVCSTLKELRERHSLSSTQEAWFNFITVKDMIKRLQLLLLALSLFTPASAAQAQKESPHPPIRKIPGINAQDPFPYGCVDCHISYPERKMDTRLSTLMKQWNEKINPTLLAKAQASAPKGIKLVGKHPTAGVNFEKVPESCLLCHNVKSKIAPPFSSMMHAIHLNGGENNHYLINFQAECLLCHKLNPSTGQISIPSGAEK